MRPTRRGRRCVPASTQRSIISKINESGLIHLTKTYHRFFFHPQYTSRILRLSILRILNHMVVIAVKDLTINKVKYVPPNPGITPSCSSGKPNCAPGADILAWQAWKNKNHTTASPSIEEETQKLYQAQQSQEYFSYHSKF